MCIEPALDVVPLGFKLDGSGIDDAIWFKFVAKTDDIANVFSPSKVDPQKLATHVKLDGTSLPVWWDVGTRSLLGGQVELPNARFMNVGYANNADGTLTVYIMWHET